MEYIVERDLFMSKLQTYLNKKIEEGYTLEKIFVSEQDERTNSKGDKYYQASKVTVIMYK